MTVDIVIPTFNNEEFTLRCLKSIRKHTQDYRVIWVDNGSTSASRQQVMSELAHHKCYRTIWLCRNYGFVKAVNIGIKACDSEFVVLQNNDTEVTAGWLTNMMPAFGDEKVMVAGPLTDTDGSWQGWRNVKSKMLFEMRPLDKLSPPQLSAYLVEEYAGKFVDVKMVAFFSAVFRGSVFKKVGMLDELFGVGFGDDDDYCRRVLDSGGKIVFVPSSFVHHYHRTTFKSLYKQDEIDKMQRTNLAKYRKKHNI